MADESTSASKKPNIVIIGGGYGGLQTALGLDKSVYKTHQIVLIERKSHFWHSVGGLRSMAEENWEDRLFIPYENAFKNGTKVIHATVITIHKNEVIVSTETEWGTHIPFEYLIIATGSDYPKPAKIGSMSKEDAKPEIQEQREAVKKASKILIVGGGPIGIELAGELASTYKDKEITIVHAQDNLLNSRLPLKLRSALKRQLEALNVKLLLGERIVMPEEGLGLTPRTLRTESGKEIESDVQFYAAGAKPNTEVVATLNESLLESDTRLVKVTQYLQLDHDEYKHIFAVGDITNIDEIKLAFKAGLQADVLVKNLEIMVSDKKKKKLNEYKSGPDGMFVTVGRNGGGGLLPMLGGIVIGEFMVKKIKGKNLFADRYWKILTNGPPPS